MHILLRKAAFLGIRNHQQRPGDSPLHEQRNAHHGAGWVRYKHGRAPFPVRIIVDDQRLAGLQYTPGNPLIRLHFESGPIFIDPGSSLKPQDIVLSVIEINAPAAPGVKQVHRASHDARQ